MCIKKVTLQIEQLNGQTGHIDYRETFSNCLSPGLKIGRFFYGLMLNPHFTLFDLAKHDTDTW